MSSWSSVRSDHRLARIGLGQGLFDPLGRRRSGLTTSGSTRAPRRFVVGCQTRLSAKTMRDDARSRRRPSARASDSRSPGRTIVRKPGGREAAPGQRRILDLAQLRAPPGSGPAAPATAASRPVRAQGDAVGERVGRPDDPAGEDRVDRLLGVRPRPPDQLDRDTLAVAGDALRRLTLWAPACRGRVSPASAASAKHSSSSRSPGVTMSISMSETSSATPRDTLPVRTTSSMSRGSVSAIRCATARSSAVFAVSATGGPYFATRVDSSGARRTGRDRAG